jgi:hypothetical protein
VHRQTFSGNLRLINFANIVRYALSMTRVKQRNRSLAAVVNLTMSADLLP